VKTARFAKVVEAAGKPEIYLALRDPAKDRKLQAAMQAQRVMTVIQESVGTKADHGEVGFKSGPGRQFLVFPKTLIAFAGRSVVGIRYDLLENRDLPKEERAAPARPPKEPKLERPRGVHPVKSEPAVSPKVIAFKPQPPEEDEDEAVIELKKKVRHAMAILEEGKAVAAFNLLKQIVGD
jgi:hypothetical protein